MKTFGRRTTAVILSVIMILSCFAGLSFSSSAETSGDYTYYDQDDGTISIREYNGSDPEVVIPSEIDGKTVTDIRYAFIDCTFLTSVTIPATIKKVNYHTFQGCTSLKNVTIPDGVTALGDYVFNQCTSLESITIPASVTDFGCGVFQNCTSLKSIEIPYGIEKIYASTFKNCTSLTDITIPDSVKVIGSDAFSGCDSLENVTLPDSVTTIESAAFSLCPALKSIKIPANVKEIESLAFEDCDNLTAIEVDEANEYYKSIDGVLFTKDGTELVYYPCALQGGYIVPDGVTEFGYCSFYNCAGLTDITFPDSLTRIGEGAFFKCTSLKNADFPENLTEIGSAAFDSCSSLTSVTIPDSVKTIGDWAFLDCTSLKKVIITAGVTEIGEYAFGYNIEIVDSDEQLSLTDGFTICSESGSAAETYANANGFKFVDVNACEHTDTVILNAKDASCTEKGYSGDKVCEICGTTVETGTVTDALGHIDEDGDGVCDRCSEKMSESKSCGCICHKNGFMKFIYKIFRFFWRIFGIKKSCGCGQLHY